MSVKVISAVMSHSEARLAARLVLLAIADNAEDGSGIGFPPIVDHPETPESRRRSIAFKTRLSEREVRDSLRELEAMGELLTTQAQRGRSRINVYRVTVGYLRDRDPQIDDLPFKLLQPFPTTTGGIRRQSDEGTGGEVRRLPGAGLAAEDRVDHRQSTTTTTGTADIHARDSKIGPEQEPPSKPAPADADAEREELRQGLQLALTAALGATRLTRSEEKAWQAAVDELLDVGATIAEVGERCAAYRATFPSAALTPLALVRHWNLLGGKVALESDPERADPAHVERWIEKTAWRLEADQVRDLLHETGFSPDAIEDCLNRAETIRAERAAGESAARAAIAKAEAA